MRSVHRSSRVAPRTSGSEEAAVRQPIPKAERALVVFGCGLDKKGRPKPPLQRRLQTALDEAKRDPDAIIVVTGGMRSNEFPEGIGMRDWLVAHGVSAARIVVEDKAWDTLENAEFVAPLLKQAGVRRATVVTEEYHVHRAHQLLEHALSHVGARAQVDDLPAPDVFSGLDAFKRTIKERAQLQQDRIQQRLLHLRNGGSFFD